MVTNTSKIDQVLYWVGPDRVLIDDVTPAGLHRKHIVRTRGMPDINTWTASFPQADVQAYVDTKGVGHLWLYWKEKEVIHEQH